MKREPFANISGTLLMTAFLVLTLAFAVQGSFETRSQIANAFARQDQIERAQIQLEELLRLQIDEENSLRGYSLTRDPFYVGQYRQAAAGYDATEEGIRRTLREQDLAGSGKLLAIYGYLQDLWRAKVARPLLRHPRQRLVELDKRNKLFSDYETRTVAEIRTALANTNGELDRNTQMQLDRSSYVRAFWVLVFGLLAILFNVFRSRLNRELEQERTITEILQRAFRSESVPLPHCEVGSAYLSATSHMAVGGDVFDVLPALREPRARSHRRHQRKRRRRCGANRIHQVHDSRDRSAPRSSRRAILAEFNSAFSRAVGNPYLFVSMFVGVLDTSTFRLEYGSAGHDCAFLRRRGTVEQLSVTGPVLGVMEEPFYSKRSISRRGDTLVLATDGLTEVRDRDGNPLTR